MCVLPEHQKKGLIPSDLLGEYDSHSLSFFEFLGIGKLLLDYGLEQAHTDPLFGEGPPVCALYASPAGYTFYLKNDFVEVGHALIRGEIWEEGIEGRIEETGDAEDRFRYTFWQPLMVHKGVKHVEG